MKKAPTPQRGFTLIELMVTVALVVILMMVATPSFVTFQRNAELTSRMNSLVASINTARGEAMKRGRDAVILPKDGSSWDSGMIAFVDMNSNRTYESATDILIYKNEDPKPSYLTISGDNAPFSSTPYIRFDAQGYPKPAGSDLRNFTISIARNDVTGTEVFNQTRRLKVSISGRTRTCRPTSSTDAACLESTTTGE
jgi:type IV fimbrial biogenesis protein FimT